MSLESIRFLGKSVGVVFGGLVITSMVSTALIGFKTEEKRKKSGVACRTCRGKGFYICRLCKGDATIKWSPLYDPVCINPCLCPTCDGNRVQRCLNCIGKGYY